MPYQKTYQIGVEFVFFLLCFRRFALADGDEVCTYVDEEETRSEVGSCFRDQINVADAKRRGGAGEVLTSSDEGSKTATKETRGFDRSDSEGLNRFETDSGVESGVKKISGSSTICP